MHSPEKIIVAHSTNWSHFLGCGGNLPDKKFEVAGTESLKTPYSLLKDHALTQGRLFNKEDGIQIDQVLHKLEAK